MNEAMVGIWTYRPQPDLVDEDVLCVFADDRLVLFFRQHPSQRSYVGMTMRAFCEGDDVYRIKTVVGAVGYLVTMRRDGHGFIVASKSRSYVFRPVQEADVPDWFDAALGRVVWR